MIWAETIFALVLGLVVAGPIQNIQADDFFNLRAKNFTQHGKPENKTHHYSAVTPAIVDNVLYMKYACQGKQNGLRLPIEGSCTEYLHCQQGLAKLMTCKAGKHFSTFGLACIDIKLSNCTVKCECCDKPDGLYPDVTNCANFIVCLKGKAHRQSCGSIFKFNSEKLMCDIPQRARCSEIISNSTFIERKIESQGLKTPLYMVSHKVCRNRSNGFTVGVPGSCNKFYLCVNGKGYLKSCGHMQFNAVEHYCDARTRIYCPEFEENYTVLESDEIPKPWLRPEMPVPQIPQYPEDIYELQPPHRVPGKPFPQEQVPNGDVLLHPPVVGKPEIPNWGNNSGITPHLPEGSEKPENTPYYPPHQGSHAIPPVVDVDPVPTPPNAVVPDAEEVIDPKEYAGLCADQSVGALIGMPKHCTKYIRCKWDWYERRVAEIESCPKDKHFNAKSKICDVPERAGCIFHVKRKHF